jgi:hypothetical protein
MAMLVLLVAYYYARRELLIGVKVIPLLLK